MGYELHLTRAEHWWPGAEPPIPEAEWLRFAGDNPLLVSSPNPGFYQWRTSDGPSLWWSRGVVHVKGVEDDEQARAIAGQAHLLGARLVGDDGEQYEPR